MDNKEGKGESRKRGMTESEKREVEMTDKVEKETPRKNRKKRAKRALRFPETDLYFVLHYIISTLFRVIYL